MSDKAPAWVVPVMRSGYAARAVVYIMVGGLALVAAVHGGNAQGTTNALGDLRAQPWGGAMLWVVAAGLLCYTAWRLIDAWMDLEDHGHGAKGLFARGALVVTGLVHGALGLSAARLAMGGAGAGGGNGGTQGLTARVMALPYGAWIIGAVGLATIGAGVYYMNKGWSGTYRNKIRTTGLTIRLDDTMKAGFIAQGIVVAIIGAMIAYAALTTDPSEAGGVGQALQQIRSVTFGRFLLGAIALGLLAFAVENMIEAVYRILPRLEGGDVATLAQRMTDKAEEMAHDATG